MNRLLGILLLLIPLASPAQDQPIVRLELLPEAVSVGESATLRVTVLGPTWFARPPVFPSFEVPNAVVRLPTDSSMPTSEQIGGQQWSGVIRDYQVFPLMAAEYTVGGQSVRVSIANPGSDPLVVDAEMPEVVLRAAVPAGAEGLDPYLAGSRLELSREVDSEKEMFEAGDAVVVTTVAEVDGLPAIFLPPMTVAQERDGVSVYPQEPVVEDGPVARRTEKTTLVFTAGGEYTVPGISLDWWNSESSRIETAALPELSFRVKGPPAPMHEDRAAGDEKRNWLRVALTVSGLLLMLILVLRFGTVVSKTVRRIYGALREAFRSTRLPPLNP